MRGPALFCVVLGLVGCESRPATSPAPAKDLPAPVCPIEAAGLHNAFRVSDRLFSGSSPEGDEGFAELQRLGVKTVISVDGAKPDVEAARRHGLTYIHLPFGYDGIPHDRVLALVKAATALPGPIYVHCHHGKHRGPAAVAVIQLCTDPTWDAATAEVWLRSAGTDSRYTALFGLPRSLARPTADELSSAPAAFPALATVPDLARLMVKVDARWDHLMLVKAAKWGQPPAHPDIDPPHEAVQLAEHFREALRLDSAKRWGSEFVGLLVEAETAARELEGALRASPPDPDRAGNAFARSAAACATCHERFRDRPGVR